jgi:hypothetical protein
MALWETWTCLDALGCRTQQCSQLIDRNIKRERKVWKDKVISQLVKLRSKPPHLLHDNFL